MTALDLFHSLHAQGISLTPSPDGTVRYRAPKGALTPTLLDTMRQHKAALHALAEAAEERTTLQQDRPPLVAPVLPAVEPPLAADGPSLRQWVTGQIPDTATRPLLAPLPPPTYHDVPSPPQTYWGKPCTVHACQRTDPTATRTLRFAPSALCVACWQRLDKTTTQGDADD
jgi:hypothetical protein